jgi:hypothetical protein
LIGALELEHVIGALELVDNTLELVIGALELELVIGALEPELGSRLQISARGCGSRLAAATLGPCLCGTRVQMELGMPW